MLCRLLPGASLAQVRLKLHPRRDTSTEEGGPRCKDLVLLLLTEVRGRGHPRSPLAAANLLQPMLQPG